MWQTILNLFGKADPTISESELQKWKEFCEPERYSMFMSNLETHLNSFSNRGMTNLFIDHVTAFMGKTQENVEKALEDVPNVPCFEYFDRISEEEYMSIDKKLGFYTKKLIEESANFNEDDSLEILNDQLITSESKKFEDILVNFQKDLLLDFNSEITPFFEIYQKFIEKIKRRFSEMEVTHTKWKNQINNQLFRWMNHYLYKINEFILDSALNSKIQKQTEIFDEKANIDLKKLAHYLALTNQRAPITGYSESMKVPLFTFETAKILV